MPGNCDYFKFSFRKTNKTANIGYGRRLEMDKFAELSRFFCNFSLFFCIIQSSHLCELRFFFQLCGRSSSIKIISSIAFSIFFFDSEKSLRQRKMTLRTNFEITIWKLFVYWSKTCRFFYKSLNRCWDPKRDFQKVFIEMLKELNNNAFHLDVVVSQGISYCFRLERMIGKL